MIVSQSVEHRVPDSSVDKFPGLKSKDAICQDNLTLGETVLGLGHDSMKKEGHATAMILTGAASMK